MGFFCKDAKLTADGIRMVNALRKLSSAEIKIGFLESSGGYEDGTTVAQVAAWNEFGTEHSPSRPFMRQTLKDQREEITKFARDRAKGVVNGSMSAQMALNGIGSYVKGRMQAEIRDGEFEPNAPSTVAHKGSSKPLIDTGRMRQSIVYVITSKEG